MLYTQFFPVPRPEGFLIIIKKYFQVTGDTGLVVREAVYSLGRQGGVFTEFEGKGSDTVSVLSICIQEVQCFSGAVNILIKCW